MPRKVSWAALAAVALLSTPALATPAIADEKSKDGTKPASRLVEERGNNCYRDFIDSQGELWDIDGYEGYVSDGTDDAYDTMGEVYVSLAGEDQWWGYYNDSGTCTEEEDGRELVLPFQELDLGAEYDRGVSPTVEMQRKIYVPSSGLPFARFLDVIRNPGTEPITIDYNWYGNYGDTGPVLDTTSGDDVIGIGERWAVIENEDSGSGHTTSLWDGPNADGWDEPYDETESIPGDGQDYVDYVYKNITIPAGGTVTLMHIEHQSTDPEVETRDAADDAVAFARAHGDGHADFFAGLSETEQRTLRNWRVDGDGDGVLDGDDNCDTTPNADQADLDGDGAGNACDDDIDNDGVPNSVETGLRSNSHLADSDGDGKADGVDSCPTLAGANADGCPSFVNVIQASSGRGLPTGVSLNVQVQRGGEASAAGARAAQARGITVRSSGKIQLARGTSTSACAGGRVAVVIKQNKRTISTRIVNVRSDCSYRSTVRFRRKLGRQSLRVKSYFFGSQGLVGRAAKSKIAKLS